MCGVAELSPIAADFCVSGSDCVYLAFDRLMSRFPVTFVPQKVLCVSSKVDISFIRNIHLSYFKKEKSNIRKSAIFDT